MTSPSTVREGGQWLPIESAPKDATEIDILTLHYEHKDPCEAKTTPVQTRYINCKWEEAKGGWVEEGTTIVEYKRKATHWMLSPINPPVTS